MKNTDNSCSNMLPNKVKIDLDMFGALMLNGVGGHVDSVDVVTIDQGSPVDRNMQLE